jgi:choline-phosphate cytidylyltransferase
MLHYGHIRLLKRAKALGDYLIVGVTADDFDISRGKINEQQTLMERLEAVKATGLADQIIVEEYEGQKIDDIRRYGVDIFTVGSDWEGKFDYLKEYCKVVYLPRTEGISSTEIRAKERALRLGFAGNSTILEKYYSESAFVNGLESAGICAEGDALYQKLQGRDTFVTKEYEALLENSDAVYLVSNPEKHYGQIRKALENGKHVLCESPLTLSKEQCRELTALAADRHLILMEALKTAYATAYNRLLLLVKSGRIGRTVSVDAVCTSLRDIENDRQLNYSWNSICAWGPTAMLPVFQILGTEYTSKKIETLLTEDRRYDAFTKVSFTFPGAVASIQVGQGVKSEGELVISGTKGYIYVPAPWWKTDYFEIRNENPAENKRYFYQLDGEGIRYTLVSFIKSIESGKQISYVDSAVTEALTGVIEDFYSGRDCTILQ